MAIHEEESPLSDAVVILRTGQEFHVEDWWDRISSTPDSNDPLTIEYASRRHLHNLPDDNNILYGWLNGGDELLVNTCEVDDFQGPS